ncbi:hypothetical protein [Nocardia araoensis]|nr:hypothetical protein [Nocardia araoensis]
MNEHQPERCLRHRRPGWQRSSAHTWSARRHPFARCVRRTGDTA